MLLLSEPSTMTRTPASHSCRQEVCEGFGTDALARLHHEAPRHWPAAHSKTAQCTNGVSPPTAPAAKTRPASPRSTRPTFYARAKNLDHPIFDPQTHRRMHHFDFCALSFERHCFWAKETVGFVKKLAHSRAAALGLEPSEEIRRWYAAISCCIQRSNAKVLRDEPVPSRPTPPPSRFAATGRDLPFAA